MFKMDSVGKRFLVPTIALLVVLLGSLGAVLVLQNKSFAESLMHSRGESMANFMGKVGSGYIAYFNLQELDNLVDQAIKDPDILWVAFRDDKGQILTQKAEFPPRPKDDGAQVVYSREFKDPDGKATGSMELIYSRKSLDRNTFTAIVVVLGGVAVTLVLFVLGMLFLTRSILRPIQELTAVVREVVAKGDLRQTIRVGTNDEIGQLGSSFQEMVGKLRGALSNLQSSSQQLDQSVAKLTNATNEQSQTISKQAVALQETQVTAQEIKQTSAIAAEKADSVLKVMERADQISQAGEAAVEQSIAGFREIRDQVKEISTKINQLSVRAQQIADITQTVKDLADQSNMLALNAAIEAARGGEHGKGFAVVAREIRSLADQSVQATGRVRDILNDITSAIREAVSITQTGAQRIDAGMAQVNSSGESVRQLSAIVKENSAAARQIASAVGQQNAGINQIFIAVTDLSKMMDEAMKRLDSTTQASATISDVSRASADIVKSYTV